MREDDEVVQGKIPGARHIPLGQIPDLLDEIDQAQHHFMVCRSGGRSGKACAILKEQGYDVTNVVGGMLDWEDEVEKKPQQISNGSNQREEKNKWQISCQRKH